MRNRAVRILLTVGLMLVTGFASRGERAQQADAPKPEPVLANGELMSLVMEPLYKELQRAMEKPPRDRKAWAAIYSAAVRLAEANNLLFFRPATRFTSDPRWAALCADSRTAAVDLAEVVFVGLQNVRPSDYVAVKAKYPAISASCNACHRGLGTDARTVRP